MIRRTFITLAAIALAACSAPAPKQPEAYIPPAPATYKVKFETTKGDFVLVIHRAWAAQGADRFWELIHRKFYDGQKFFRVRPGFIVQWGINGDPKVQMLWHNANIPDDPVKEQNTRGRITFATSGPSTRTTQVFINYEDNTRLDSQGFAPFGYVTEGMDVIERFYSGYGEGAPRGTGPDQDKIQQRGNAYLEAEFPRLDAIKTARIVE